MKDNNMTGSISRRQLLTRAAGAALISTCAQDNEPNSRNRVDEGLKRPPM